MYRTAGGRSCVPKFVDNVEGEESLAAVDATATTLGDDDFFEEDVIIVFSLDLYHFSE